MSFVSGPAWVVGLAATVASLWATLDLGLQHAPQATLYTSGLSLFPSPLGTLIGTLLGVTGWAVLQALVIGLLAARLVELRPPVVSVVVGLPVLIWLAPLGVNVLAGAAFVLGWSRSRSWLLWVAGGLHLATLLQVAMLVRRSWLVVGAGLCLLLVTPYTAGIRTALDPSLDTLAALLGGVVVGVASIAPGLVGGVPVWRPPLVLLGIAVAAGSAYAIRFDLTDGYEVWTSAPQTMRYGIPVVFVCLLEAGRGRVSSVASEISLPPATLERPTRDGSPASVSGVSGRLSRSAGIGLGSRLLARFALEPRRRAGVGADRRSETVEEPQ